TPLTYTNAAVTITKSDGTPLTISNLKKSTLIDGWQRVECNITIPANCNDAISVNLVNNSSSSNVKAYFDDIRLQPGNSSMKSYVYHPVNLRYMAELD